MAAHRLVIFGSTGRMGQSLIKELRGDTRFQLCGAVASAHSARLGKDAAADGEPCGVGVSADAQEALQDATLAMDFSLAEAVAAHAQACALAGVPVLIGVTGLDAAGLRQVQRAAQSVAVLIAANTSVAVAVLERLSSEAALALGNSYDVEIAETHHRDKRDAPSGTALRLGDSIAAARGQRLADVAAHARHGSAALRQPGSIGFAVTRAGEIVGEHTVLFAGAGESLQITHRALDRATFARGALRAGAWLAGRAAGLYGMHDVIAG